VQRVIPRQILERAFIRRLLDWRTTVASNLDHAIRYQVIQPRVLYDCNIVGGVQALIPLGGLEQQKPTELQTILQIPKDRTGGRSILSVNNVTFFNQSVVSSWATNSTLAGYNQFNRGENNALTAAAAAVVAAQDTIPVTSTANCSLIGENTILVKDSMLLAPNAFLRCTLANDEQLANLQIRSHLDFAQLVEHAVKAHVYVTLIVEIGSGELQGGAELGVFKSLVEEYRDSNQNYLDFLRNTWQKVALMNDDTSYDRYMRMMVGSNR
jgi:hypothetical protein